MTATRRLVVAGGDSGRAASYESAELPPAVELGTTTVHEVVEVRPDGTVADRSLPWHHDPEPDGSIFRLVTFAGAVPDAPPKSLHSTATVDVGVIVEGAVTLVLPEGAETALNAGDSFVLRGVEHTWRNDAAEPCVMAVTLLKPSAWSGLTAR